MHECAGRRRRPDLLASSVAHTSQTSIARAYRAHSTAVVELPIPARSTRVRTCSRSRAQARLLSATSPSVLARVCHVLRLTSPLPLSPLASCARPAAPVAAAQPPAVAVGPKVEEEVTSRLAIDSPARHGANNIRHGALRTGPSRARWPSAKSRCGHARRVVVLSGL